MTEPPEMEAWQNELLRKTGSRVVGRDQEVLRLGSLLAGGNGPAPNVLVCGRPESGKTSVVR